MADIKAIKDQIWYIKRDIQNEEKKRDEWATTVSPSWRRAPTISLCVPDLWNRRRVSWHGTRRGSRAVGGYEDRSRASCSNTRRSHCRFQVAASPLHLVSIESRPLHLRGCSGRDGDLSTHKGMSTGAPSRDRRSRRLPPQSTYISPVTGERIKRVFTLRDASHRTDDDGPTDERQPLLPRSIPPPDNSWQSRTKQRLQIKAKDAWKFAKSSKGQGVLKCSLAYALGSLATFVPAIGSLIGKADSKHVVCTVTVYFSPARTIGSMHEGVVLALIAFCYAAFIAYTSMAVSMGFGARDLLQVGHAIVLVVFCGGGLGFIAWTKQHFGHPLVNVACSLASLGCVSTPGERRRHPSGSLFQRQSVSNPHHGHHGHLRHNPGELCGASCQGAKTPAQRSGQGYRAARRDAGEHH